MGDICKTMFSFLQKAVSTNQNNSYTALFLFINYFSGGDRRSRQCHNSGLSGNSGKTRTWKPLFPRAIFPQRTASLPHTFGMTWLFSHMWEKQNQRPIKITIPLSHSVSWRCETVVITWGLSFTSNECHSLSHLV